MQVVVAKSCGFCVGVRRAVETAMNVSPQNTYVYGELIHNEDVVKRISERGLVTIENLSEVPDGATLLIRSHGAAKSVFDECERRGIQVIDCTCSFVKKTQEIVKKASKEGKTVVIAGSKSHPEVVGLVGWCSGETLVTDGETQDFSKILNKDVVLVSQTTFSEKSFYKIAQNLQKLRLKTVEIFPTICYTTVRRQKEAEELAKMSDAVLVIGGKNSSNTNKLAEIASTHCKRVYRLTGADDFKYENIKNCKRVGVIAGASTPDWQTQEVLSRWQTSTRKSTE